MNSAFGARWLASPEVIIQVLFTSEQPKRNKMSSSFAWISKKEILAVNEEAVPKNTKMATEYLMVSYLISPASYSKAKNQNAMPCLRKLSNTKNETPDVFQLGFNNTRNLTQPLRKWHCSNLTSACLKKFYLSARRRDGTFYNNKSLTAIRAALDRHLRSPPLNKPFSIIGDPLFTEANKTLNNYLKKLSAKEAT